MRKAFHTLICLLAMMSAGAGLRAQEVTIVIEPGWNWISYPNAESMPLVEALSGFVPSQGDQVKSKYTTSTYTGGRWRGGVSYFEPGKGYHYYSTRTEDVELVFAHASSNAVATAMPTDITAVSAVVGGMVMLPEGTHVFLRGVCWGTMPSPDIDGDHTSEETGIGSFSSTLEGLNPNTIYYVRAYAVTDHGLAYGNEASFTTLSGIPVVTTAAVTNVTGNSALCGGTVTDGGGLAITARGVCWSTSHNPTIAGSHTTNGTGTGSFTSSITGLSTSTTYYVRAYATTAQATSYGEEMTFTTMSGIPTVSTAEVTDITATTATCGGTIGTDGGLAITTRGVCWSTSHNPTIAGSHTTNGTGTGSYTSSITGLSTSTTYYVRAYATNSYVTIYGGEQSFTTEAGGGSGGDAPTGAINGKFTINSDGDQVYFSQGNLQYIGSASTPYWKFADNQWDVLSTTTGQNSSSQNVDRDLFGWGTSGYNHGANCYQPWSTSQTNSDYYAYGDYQYNLYDQTGQADWGYNPISNGGNQANQWRTLTKPEWAYVFNTRTTNSGIRYAKAKVNDVNGVILLPDDWSSDTYSLSNTNSTGASFTSNTISASQWSALEQAGAVFLPSAGNRLGTSVLNVGCGCCYWSASCSSSSSAFYVNFYDSNLLTGDYDSRSNGFSVRLARSSGDHAYVDLGLPSGLLWATCNVGADSPEDYGDYFAWGETQPKDTYNWSTYQYCMGSSTTMTKYCNNSSYGYNGYTDDLTNLLPEDDAATANWGSEWRMPTHAEWEELYDNTTNTWTTQNGVYGRLFTAPNGNSLFLPAAGYRDGSSLYGAGSGGNYWSSSLYTFYPDLLWYFGFYSRNCDVGGTSRYYGDTVRPVRSSRQN